MNLQPQLEEARRRFARSLVGHWSTSQGTFDVVMEQHWEIRPDGTGKFVDTGAFGEPRGETRFEWRQSEPFAFELREGAYVSFLPDEAAEPDDEVELADDDLAWRTIRYDFIVLGAEFGYGIGLIDVAQIGTEYAGFWMSLAPLAFAGPIETAS